MMKKFLKRASVLILALAMVLSMSTTALAEDATITFVTANDPTTGTPGLDIEFAPGSKYTSSDLFDNFKNLMPGDTKTQKITISNQAKNCDYVEVWMYVKPHDANENEPLVKDDPGYKSLDEMWDFLHQLSMTIAWGEDTILLPTANNTDRLSQPTYLGTVDANNNIVLNVTLEVPIDLDNKYADRVGEVDWVFYAVGYNYESVTVQKVWDDGGNKYKKRPSSVEVQLLKDGEPYGESVELSKENDWTYTWEQLMTDEDGKFTVKEVKVPSGYHVSYKEQEADGFHHTWKIVNSMKLIQTGQLNWPIPVLGSLGVLMLCVGIILLKRKEQKNA